MIVLKVKFEQIKSILLFIFLVYFLIKFQLLFYEKINVDSSLFVVINIIEMTVPHTIILTKNPIILLYNLILSSSLSIHSIFIFLFI